MKPRGPRVRVKQFLLPIVAAVTVTAAVLPIKTRSVVPAVMIRRPEQKPVALSSRVAERSALLLLRSDPTGKEDCEKLSSVARKLEGSNLITVVDIRGEDERCVPVPAYVVENGGAESPLGTGALRPGEWRAILVDTSGVVRLVRDIPADVSALPKAQQMAADWEAGRLSFITNCGHCHGDDGGDTSYPNIKTMAGISTRMTAEKILEGGQMFGAVDTASWTASVKEAVLLYIEGL